MFRKANVGYKIDRSEYLTYREIRIKKKNYPRKDNSVLITRKCEIVK